MLLNLAYLSANYVLVVSTAVSSVVLFGIVFCVALIMFALAMQRHTIITTLLSSILWFGLAFATLGFGDVASNLTLGASYVFTMLGIVMMIYTFYVVFDNFRMAAEERQRKLEEEIA